MISARWAPRCNRDRHLEGTSHHLSVSFLNWSKSGISVSPILFTYLVSSKLSPAHIFDGGCTGLVLLMEIHYSKIDNIIPLINGNGFQVDVTMAHYSTWYLSTLFKCDADRKTTTKKKRLFLLFCNLLSTLCAVPLVLITSASSSS